MMSLSVQSPALGSSRALGGTQLRCCPCLTAACRGPAARQVTCMAQKLRGKVVSIAMDKTAVVEVITRRKHRLYNKLEKTTSKYLAHDPANSCQIGDLVQIFPVPPISKRKRFLVEQVVEQSELQDAMVSADDMRGNEPELVGSA